MISKDEIMEVVRSLANQIKEDYKGCRPVMVCVLKGANPVSPSDINSAILFGFKI